MARPPVIGHLDAHDDDPGQRLLRVLVADHAGDWPGRGRRMPEIGRVVGRGPFGREPERGHGEGLSRARQDPELLAGDGRAVELRHDEAVASDAGEPETPFGIGGELRGRRDGAPREIRLLELVACPPPGPGGFEPGTEVFPDRGADLQHLEGRAGDRLPLEIDDLAGDRPVLDELKRQVVTPAPRGNFRPGDPVADRRRRDDGLLKSEFHVVGRELSPPAGAELEAAVRSGRRGLVRRVRVPEKGIAEGRRGRSSHPRWADHPARVPARQP